VIAGLLRVAPSFRSRRKTGRLRLYIATAESGPEPLCASIASSRRCCGLNVANGLDLGKPVGQRGFFSSHRAAPAVTNADCKATLRP
jgi:hypothetical protein